MAKNSKQGLRGAYEQSRKVSPRPITGKEKPVELLELAFGAYVGRQERTAFELMSRSVDDSFGMSISCMYYRSYIL